MTCRHLWPETCHGSPGTWYQGSARIRRLELLPMYQHYEQVGWTDKHFYWCCKCWGYQDQIRQRYHPPDMDTCTSLVYKNVIKYFCILCVHPACLFFITWDRMMQALVKTMFLVIQWNSYIIYSWIRKIILYLLPK